MSFELDPRLEADTHAVCDLGLSTVRLMNDSRFLWLILVPQKPGLAELTDLGSEERHRLTDEIDRASRVVAAEAKADKMNVAALGNSVRQLHIHIIARHEGDEAWPGPVWGKGSAEAYADPSDLIARLADALDGH